MTHSSEARIPTVSVCIPVYNGERFIGEAITSVLNQTLQDFELVILDNASTDGTLDVARTFEDPRVRIVEGATNIGAGANWNRALAEAKSDLVKILCADDVLLPDILARQVAIMTDPANAGVVLTCARRYIIGDDGTRTLVRGLRREGPVPGAAAVRIVARSGSNPIGETSSVLLRREAALAAGGFRVDSPYVVDVDLWMRLLAIGDLYVLREVLSEYRVSRGSWSVDVRHRQAADYQEMLHTMLTSGVHGLRTIDVRIGTLNSFALTALRQVYYRIFTRAPEEAS